MATTTATPATQMESTNVDEVSQVTTQFDGIVSTLSAFRSQITLLQQQLRSLEKAVSKEFRGLKKEAAKKKQQKGNRKPSGFAVPTKISDELCKFMGLSSGAEVARTEVTQAVIKYIREHSLQNPENKKIIKPDATLKKLLDVKSGDEVTYFNLQKFMNRHFQKKTPVTSA
jgi:chromatin remodeling complex protein RSC6